MREKVVYGAGLGFFVSAVMNAILVIVKEYNEGFKDWLKTTFTHHWLGHGILVIAIFILTLLLGYAGYRGGLAQAVGRAYVYLLLGSLLSLVMIWGFYILHFLGVA